MEDVELVDLYTLLELAYQDVFKDRAEVVEDLYPEGWYGSTDYKKKIEVLTEAIDNDKLIVETVSYQTMLEGVDPESIDGYVPKK